MFCIISYIIILSFFRKWPVSVCLIMSELNFLFLVAIDGVWTFDLFCHTQFCITELFYDSCFQRIVYAFIFSTIFFLRKTIGNLFFSSVWHYLMVFPAVSMTMRLLCHSWYSRFTISFYIGSFIFAISTFLCSARFLCSILFEQTTSMFTKRQLLLTATSSHSFLVSSIGLQQSATTLLPIADCWLPYGMPTDSLLPQHWYGTSLSSLVQWYQCIGKPLWIALQQTLQAWIFLLLTVQRI